MAAAQQVREKAAPNIEFSFSLTWGCGPPQPFTLRGTTARITVGRRLDSHLPLAVSSVSYDHCELFLKRKGRDLLLCVRDLSKNLTGVRHPRAAQECRPWRELRREEVEVLQHRSELMVPARQRKGSGKVDSRTHITVVFLLPDGFCPWRNTGRWHYEEKLGEGGLAVVYRATDMEHGLGQVAVKVSKFAQLPAASQQNRHIYTLHREARWSMERLHNPRQPAYRCNGAALFVRYLEDHTGFSPHAPNGDFDELRKRFEDPGFSWADHTFVPSLPRYPYVVMDFVDGRLLQSIVEGGPALDTTERRAVVHQCCEALVYMEGFSVVHRDFRGCNIFLQGRGPACRIKVIDLGFMISSEPGHASNPNPAIRCAWQGDPERKLRFDWAPPEVRTVGSPNFAVPACCFDVFSLGVLILKLLHGRTWAQDVLQSDALSVQLQAIRQDVEEVGLGVDVLVQMLSRPERRPRPKDILLVDRALAPSSRERVRHDASAQKRGMYFLASPSLPLVPP